MLDAQRYYTEFEALVGQIFEELGYRVEVASRRKSADRIHEMSWRASRMTLCCP
jgi:hypothetical protein